MKVIRNSPENIGNIIASHLSLKQKGMEKPLFVFSSDIASDSWSTYIVRNLDTTKIDAVELDDFIAWDKFKDKFLASSVTDKKCIPSILRKLFIRNLIKLNNEEQHIKKIIPCDDLEKAYSFTDWLSKILPSLNLWHKKYLEYLAAKKIDSSEDTDVENQDYLYIYNTYNDFLNNNNLFEPSWLDPQFAKTDRQIIIFYPELLEDFSEYETIFSTIDNITSIQLPKNYTADNKPLVYKYSDSRKELRRTLLEIRDLHYNHNVKWSDISLCVPDMDTYRPYLKRELSEYCIPFNLRAGEKLTINSAGSIFKCISECYNSSFSFNSLRSLLQNEYIPWKEEIKNDKDFLISEGNRLRTVCNYEDENGNEKDVWIEALSNCTNPLDEIALKLYRSIKKEVTSIVTAKSFKDIHTAWIMFRDMYLDKTNFTSDANKILGRCISELDELIDIEKNYIIPMNLTVQHPFNFFLNEINNKIYRPQEVLNGISVFSYKLTAPAFIKYQFIIDASQRNLDIPYKKLSFLSTQKRHELLGNDIDENSNASSAFIALYAKCEDKSVVQFSYAEDSFSGFAIAHNALKVAELPDHSEPLAQLDKDDFVRNEKLNFISGGTGERRTSVTDIKFTERQKNSYANWISNSSAVETQKTKTIDYSVIDSLISNKLVKSRYHEKNMDSSFADKYKFTQTDIRNFFPCPRQWIFKEVLHLTDDSLDTNLMSNYDMGNINHNILEHYMKYICKYEDENGKIPKDADGKQVKKDIKKIDEDCRLPLVDKNKKVFNNEEEIKKIILHLTDVVIHSPDMDFAESPLVIKTLEAQEENIADNIMNFLHEFCKPDERPAKTDGYNYKSRLHGFGNFIVVGAEEWFNCTTSDGNLFTGKIDLLLQDPETKKFVIIDYKNTAYSIPKKSEIFADDTRLLGDFQMPVYIQLVQNGFKPKDEHNEDVEVKIEAAYFYSVKLSSSSDTPGQVAAVDEYKGFSDEVKKTLDTTKPDYYKSASLSDYEANTITVCNNYETEFVQYLTDHNFEPVNRKILSGAYVHVAPYSECVSCKFRSICRTDFTVAQNEIKKSR